MINGLAIGDVHTGSAYGLFPSGHTLSTGGVSQLNSGQRYLLDCFDHMVGELPPKLDFVAFTGDMVDGLNHKRDALGRVEVDGMWQADAAATLMAPIVKRATKKYCVAGSGYHVGNGAMFEQHFASQIGADETPGGHKVWDWLLLRVANDIVFDIAHHQSYMTVNRSTALEREMRHSELITPDMKDGTDLIIRAHVHSYGFMNLDGQLALSLPAWKLPNPYTKTSKTPNRMLSRLLGAVLIEIYPELKTEDCLNRGEYIKVKPLVYSMPRLGITELGGTKPTWQNRAQNLLYKNSRQKSPKPTRL